jgi:hypothetical protein
VGAGLLASASVSGAQVVVLMVVLWCLPAREETYYAPGPAFGFLVVALLAPFLLTVVGFGHALAVTLPAILVGRLAARRHPPAWRWSLAATAALAASYALLGWRNGVPYPVALLWTLGFSVLPVLLGHHAIHRVARGTLRSSWRLMGEVALVTAVCAALVIGLGLLGYRTGHLKEYEPPEVARADAVGTWRAGAGGTEVRLAADGRASVTDLPYGRAAAWEKAFCDGDGTWSWRGRGADGRDAVELTIPGCAGARERWMFSGTPERLELFVVLGDPDAGDLYVLPKE